jgi:hypothetical protein
VGGVSAATEVISAKSVEADGLYPAGAGYSGRHAGESGWLQVGGFAGDAITRLHPVVSRRGRFGLVAAGGSPDEAEERADFAGELFWLLECGKVAAPGSWVPQM